VTFAIRKSTLPMHECVSNMIDRLAEPVTEAELLVVSTLHKSTVRRWLGTFHRQRLVRRVGRTLPRSNKSRILYQWNPQRLPDVEIPPKLSPAQRQRNYTKRQRDAAFEAQLQQLTVKGK
jgi:hypothetical protein